MTVDVGTIGPDAIYLSQVGIYPNIGNDLTSAIQAVIDSYPGRTIVFDRPGTYLVNTVTSNTLKWCLSVVDDNTFLIGVPGAELKTTQDAALVFFAGPAKTGGFTSWATTRFYAYLTAYNLTGSYAKGVSTLTLATPAQAANFAAGDAIFIRTGQTIANGGPTSPQPDSEINEVKSVNAGTGVITLRWPTAKPYAQEYFVSGTEGLTTTNVTANPAIYGVSKVTDHTLYNVGLRGLKLTAENLSTVVLWQAYQILGFTIEDCDITTNLSNGNHFYLRDVSWRRNRIRITATTGNHWWFAPGAVSQSDVWCEDNRVYCESNSYLHLHEGGSRINCTRNIVINKGYASDVNTVSIRGRGYDIRVIDNHFYGSGTNNCVYADSTVTGGLIFDGNVVESGATNAVNFNGANQVFGPTNRIASGIVSFRVSDGTAITGGHAPVQLQYISQWVSDDNQNPTIGTVPANSRIVSVSVEVTQAWNSDGTDLLTVGYDADDDAVVTALDIATTGVKTPTAGVLVGAYNATARSIEAYYVNGGSEPTTGRALVTIAYHRCATEVI